MVTKSEHGDGRGRHRVAPPRLDGVSRVARQQHADVAVAHPEHHGVVVADATTIPVGALRMQHAHVHAFLADDLACGKRSLAGADTG
jgi:hypothetical protein